MQIFTFTIFIYGMACTKVSFWVCNQVCYQFLKIYHRIHNGMTHKILSSRRAIRWPRDCRVAFKRVATWPRAPSCAAAAPRQHVIGRMLKRCDGQAKTQLVYDPRSELTCERPSMWVLRELVPIYRSRAPKIARVRDVKSEIREKR